MGNKRRGCYAGQVKTVKTAGGELTGAAGGGIPRQPCTVELLAASQAKLQQQCGLFDAHRWSEDIFVLLNNCRRRRLTPLGGLFELVCGVEGKSLELSDVTR